MHHHRGHLPVAAVVEAQFHFRDCLDEVFGGERLPAAPDSRSGFFGGLIHHGHECLRLVLRETLPHCVQHVANRSCAGLQQVVHLELAFHFKLTVAARVSCLILSDYREAIAFVLSNLLE